MGKQTIAEFVDHDAILEMLQEIAADFAQGYGFGRPQRLGEMPSVRSAAAAKIEHKSPKCQYDFLCDHRGWKCGIQQVMVFDVTHVTGDSVRTDVDFFQAVLVCRHYGTTAVRDTRAL